MAEGFSDRMGRTQSFNFLLQCGQLPTKATIAFELERGVFEEKMLLSSSRLPTATLAPSNLTPLYILLALAL